MNIHSRPILIYRWAVFLMAAAYCVYQVVSNDYSSPFGPFRFLTIWALFVSFYSASRMLALSQGRITRCHDVTAMTAAVLNVMVCFLYWKLVFTDPALVRGSNGVIWHQEYYLHALGPALQIFDALFIAGAFRRIWRAAPVLIAVIAAYVLWSEFVLAPLSDSPVGSVTSGLPYPFLNSLELSGRMTFYISNGVVAIGVLCALGLVGWIIRRAQTRTPAT